MAGQRWDSCCTQCPMPAFRIRKLLGFIIPRAEKLHKPLGVGAVVNRDGGGKKTSKVVLMHLCYHYSFQIGGVY